MKVDNRRLFAFLRDSSGLQSDIADEAIRDLDMEKLDIVRGVLGEQGESVARAVAQALLPPLVEGFRKKRSEIASGTRKEVYGGY